MLVPQIPTLYEYFKNAVFDRSKLVLHLDKEVYKGGSLPGLIDGGAAYEIGKFNTKTK